jgi:S1-C subfamily serine protease
LLGNVVDMTNDDAFGPYDPRYAGRDPYSYPSPYWLPQQQAWYPPVPQATPASPGRGARRVLLALGTGLVAAGVAAAAVVATAGNGALAGAGSALQQQVPQQIPTVPLAPGQGGSNGGETSADLATAAQQRGIVVIDSVLGYQGALSAGTGMVLTSDGEVLTNNHVVEGATRIRVTVPATGARYSATVVGTDATDDIAVIKLSDATGLPTAKLDKDDDAKVGDAVTAVGNAGGTGSLTAAKGTIVALGQTITASDQGGQNAEQLHDLIQVNANVVSGDSGGPLYDTQGEVIGIDTAAGTSRAGTYGYAIPIDNALSVVAQIDRGVSTSTVHIGNPGMLGVTVSDASTGGALVAGVVPGGPADKAGIEQGDVITSVAGHAITSGKALRAYVTSTEPGQKVTVGWTDPAGGSHHATVTLGQGPAA